MKDITILKAGDFIECKNTEEWDLMISLFKQEDYQIDKALNNKHLFLSLYGTNFISGTDTLITKVKYQASEFLEFPEKWCIKFTDENHRIVGEYFDKSTKCNGLYTCGFLNSYVYSHNILEETPEKSSRLNFVNTFIRKGFTEISFEQFKKYVLNIKNNNIMKTTRKKLLSILGKDSCSEFNKAIEQELGNHYKISDDIEFDLSHWSLTNIHRANEKQKELLKSIGLIKELDLFSIKTYEEVCKALGEHPATITINNSATANYKKLTALVKLDQIEKLFNQDWKKDWDNKEQRKYYPWFKSKLGGWVLDGIDDSYSYSCGQVAYFKNEKTAKYVGETFIDIYKDILE